MNQQGALQMLQQKMAETQESLANETVEASVGGGVVTVTCSGQQKILSVKISPDVMTAGDVEMLQDLIVAAVNEAIEKSQQLASQKMGEITGGLGLPGLLG
ncbi:MAG: YbaB/EbfC family nucleoid-associated protein [Chloroflexi bacterium]|nr:YbaB/EbfC family nucleoid-associated protein [Chloroflexota bacterium]